MAFRPGYSYDVAHAKYEVGQHLPIYVNHKGDNQLFVLNPDGTISPDKSRNLVWGYTYEGEEHTRMRLYNKGDSKALVFDALQ